MWGFIANQLLFPSLSSMFLLLTSFASWENLVFLFFFHPSLSSVLCVREKWFSGKKNHVSNIMKFKFFSCLLNQIHNIKMFMIILLGTSAFFLCWGLLNFWLSFSHSLIFFPSTTCNKNFFLLSHLRVSLKKHKTKKIHTGKKKKRKILKQQTTLKVFYSMLPFFTFPSLANKYEDF